MCGICGILLFDKEASVDPDTLRRMNTTMTHRGPDDEGTYVEGRVGLAMRRLSIIDLELGKQPISNEDGSVWIVYNGEIYNHEELREELIAAGHTFRTRSDTEAIVHLYEQLGDRCVERLNGMFGFAIWDSKRSRLLLARDRLGIKPLFYCLEPGLRIVFASEMKALMPAGIDSTPDYQALYDYLSLMYVPTPATALKSVRKLPPGHILTYDDNGPRITQYWDIPIPERGEEERLTGSYTSDLADLLEASIRRHMIADVPVGALLSGGLDSTIVTAIMKRKLDAPVKTFTIGFKQASYNEAPDARLVAEELGTDHTEEIADPAMVGDIGDLLDDFDEPFADYSAIPTLLVSRIARKKVKVVLTGDGGDEVFAGYPTHVAPKVAALYRLIPGPLRKAVIDPLVMALPASFERVSFDYMAKRFVTGADLPLGRGHYHWKVIFDEDEKRLLCSPDLLDADLRASFHAFEPHFEKARKADPLHQLLYVDAKTFLLDDNLTKVDRMTMAASLEARVPLLDHELVEKIASLDPGVKTQFLQTKTLLRETAKGMLPPAISKGKKRGFTPPLPFWIKRELKEFVLDTLSERKIKDTGILRPGYCAKVLDDHFQGRRNRDREIWTLVSLVHWFAGMRNRR
jgi:asparagine synthase (glutamine-hydrolysing)